MINENEASEIAAKHLAEKHNGRQVRFHSVGFVSAEQLPLSYQHMGDIWVVRFEPFRGPNHLSDGLLVVKISTTTGEIKHDPEDLRPPGR